MSWIWPNESEYASEIAAWVRFDACPFSSNLEKRSRPIQTFWNSPDFIAVPLPTRIGTDLNMDYTTNAARIASDRNFRTQQYTALSAIPGTLFDPSVGDRNFRMPGVGVGEFNPDPDKKPRDFKRGDSGTVDVGSSPGNASYLDVIDTTWLGQSRRSYVFDIHMMCKTSHQSITAASICNFANGLALPQLSPMSKERVVANQFALHPFMWSIHVNDMNLADPESSTRCWLGEYPQLCVLQKVHSVRLGGDGNQIIGMRSGGKGLFTPLVYNLKLIFIELEPVYRSIYGGVESLSRSQFFTLDQEPP